MKRGWGSFLFLMNKRAQVFVAALVASALTSIGLVRCGFSHITATDVFGLVTFAALGVMSEGMAVDFQVGSAKEAKSSVSYLPLFACALAFPPIWTLLAGVVVIGSSDIFIHKRRWWVCAFNASQYVVALAGATTVYASLGGGTLSEGRLSLPAFFALAMTYFAINLIIVGIFLTLKSGRAFGVIIHEMMGPTGGNLFYDLLASPIAVLSVWLYDRMYIGGVLLGILPLLLVRYSYISALQLRYVNKDLMRVLIKAIETRDPYTSGHSVRVSSLAKAIAHDLGLRRGQIDLVEISALLHDIGKIEAPFASIISKPHELSATERAVIRTHAVKGADMLRELSAFRDEEVIKGVRHHHERFDGTGYPDGLRGEQIPLVARIIMICDAMDAMLSDRPYRSALDPESVRRELVRCSGEQFDPKIVRVILERGTIGRARELVKQQPPDAMAHPTIVAAAAGK